MSRIYQTISKLKRSHIQTMAVKPSILEVLKEKPIIGDGSYVITLEKRGYLKAGAWTPEAVIENPDAGEFHYNS